MELLGFTRGLPSPLVGTWVSYPSLSDRGPQRWLLPVAPTRQGGVCEDVRDPEAWRPAGLSCDCGAGVGSWVSSEDSPGEGGCPKLRTRLWQDVVGPRAWAPRFSARGPLSVAASFTEASEMGEPQIV